MATSNPILLQHGFVIVHDDHDRANPIKADVLIRGNTIARIGKDIAPTADVNVIDCTNRIIAPGFIDTHRHMYNIGLRGRHGDNTLEDYFVEGILQGASFDPEQVFWGQLAGCLECINAGTTTVVDHSHMNYSEEHPLAAIRATESAGLRSIYGYCFNIRVENWSPFKTTSHMVAPFAIDALKKLSSQAPFGHGRVNLGVAFDGWFLPKDTLAPLFTLISNMGVKYVTTHNSPSKPGMQSSVQKMDDCDILTKFTTILAHANSLSPEDVKLIKSRSTYISSTPSLELQMGMGPVACFDPERGIQCRSSIGVDCHNVTLASIPTEMRMALQSSRGLQHERFMQQGLRAAKVYKTVQDAYALGTIAGARAIGMQDQLGSIAVGKLADIIVFDALSPNMICGAQRDPVTAIVMHSTPADVVMTIVDGIIRKRNGRLEPVHISDSSTETADRMEWSDIAEKLLASQEKLNAKVDKIDLAAAKTGVLEIFGIDSSKIVDSI